MTIAKRPLAIIESPYAGNDHFSSEQHELYLRHAMIDSLDRGEAPFASHHLLPSVLNDGDQLERAIGIACGLAWGAHCDVVAVYSDLGVSPGMKAAIEHYKDIGKPIDWRSINYKVVQDIINMGVE